MSALEFSQLLGNYGEFVGAIAIVITLIYLSFQLRQNTRSINSNNSNTVMQGLNTFNTALFADPELVRVFYSGVASPQSLSASERQQFAHMAASLMNFYRNLYHQYIDGTYSKERWHSWEREVKQLMRTPGFTYLRTDVSKTYDDLFEYLEKLPNGDAPLSQEYFSTN